MQSVPFALPSDFLLGAATAATQIEGGGTNHTWFRWSEQGHILDGSTCLRACDHWNRIDEDVALVTKLGMHTYRLGIEWSRIEPEPGVYSREALAVYRHEVDLLLKAGVRPLVTIHHFTNPLWFEDSGGWLRGDAPRIFGGLVRFVVEGLGDLVSDWITLNEPNVYLIEGYVRGKWPPGGSSLGDFFKGIKRMVTAHRHAYALIHDIRRERGWDTGTAETRTLVGVAHHVRIFDPKRRWDPLLRLINGILDYVVQGIFVSRMSRRGRTRWADFLGLNYYTRDIVVLSKDPTTLFSGQIVKPGAPVNELGWEIYPEGLARVIRRYWKQIRLPIWITENGTCDENDRYRAAYIASHLERIAACIGEGIPVQRYYHWTLMDNFEWTEGERARFGLYHNDFETQKRTLRPSGELYALICASRAGIAEVD